MEKSISKIHNIHFEYYTNDLMAKNSIGKQKEWEPHITKFVKLFNKFYHIQNIVDIGANFGYHTIFFSKEVEYSVYAFEPQIQNFELLQNNIKNNNIKNVILYNFACGDDNCFIYMPIIQFEKNKLVNMGDFTPQIVGHNNNTIKTITLDQIIFMHSIDVIKIDVQGWEKKVLLGAKKLIETYKPVLIVEFEYFQLKKTNTTCEELFHLIREYNYYIFYLEYEYPSDHICVHNDNLDHFRNNFKEYIFPHTDNNNINNNIKHNVVEKIVMQ